MNYTLFWLGFFPFFAFFYNYGMRGEKEFCISNQTAYPVSVWSTNKHHSITNLQKSTDFWLNPDEYYGVTIINPGENAWCKVPDTRQSLFFRLETADNLPVITNRPGDDRYDRLESYRALKPGGIHLDPEPRRTFERTRAPLYPVSHYNLTHNVITSNDGTKQKGEHESWEYPNDVCGFYVEEITEDSLENVER